MYNYEILIKSFIRFQSLRRLVDSIERYYPGVTIRIVDDSPNDKQSAGFTPHNLRLILQEEDRFRHSLSKKDHIHYYKLPFDVGLSAGRNYLLRHCETKYFVLMEDDFEISQETDLARLERVISSREDIVIAAGGTYENERRYRKQIGEMRQIEDALIRYTYGNRAPKEVVGGLKCVPCRFTQNFFMGNLELFKKYNIKWEEKIKITREHAYFFFCIPKELKIYYVPHVWIIHRHSKPPGYQKFRRRSLRQIPFREVSGLSRVPVKDKRIYR